MDGNRLLPALEDYDKDVGYRGGFFDGYVTGVADTSIGKDFCPSPDVTAGQLPKIAAKYLKDHPERLHLDASRLVIDSLRAAFPCRR